MKFHKTFVFLLAFFLVLGTRVSLFAQEEMTMEEWQKQWDEYTAKKEQVTKDIDGINKEIDGLKKTSADKDAAIAKAEEELYASVGTTKAGVADWRAKFEAFEKDVKGGKISLEDCEKRKAELDKSKVKCLPEFWERWNKIKCPEPVKPSGYTVVKGDCLWKISGKKEIYGNPKVWPALWEANKAGVVSAPPKVSKTIKNPNLIYPGQVLKVPSLTEAQKNEYIKQANKYHYKKLRKKVKTEGTEKKPVDEKKKVEKSQDDINPFSAIADIFRASKPEKKKEITELKSKYPNLKFGFLSERLPQ